MDGYLTKGVRLQTLKSTPGKLVSTTEPELCTYSEVHVLDESVVSPEYRIVLMHPEGQGLFMDSKGSSTLNLAYLAFVG